TLSSAAGYIGRTVRVEGDVSQVAGGAASAMSFELGRDSARTTLEIYDASGNLVKVAELGAMTAGRRDYQWDAKKSDGSTIVDGTYRFKVTAEDANGDAIATQTSFSGTVTGVSFAQGQAMLTIGGQAYPLGSLISIGEV
ncbi:MAG: hypothetical protein M1457_07650, partial [bacterium]|nr:hypothetical protein [bacterium]